MSYFLCLAVPPNLAQELSSVFDRIIHLIDVSNAPIGQVTRGKNKAWAAYLVQVGFSSASLIGKGAIKKTARNFDRSELFISGIEALMENEACPSVSFLAHWMQGYIDTEVITVRDEKRIRVSDLKQTIAGLEEDVRYTVS